MVKSRHIAEILTDFDEVSYTVADSEIKKRYSIKIYIFKILKMADEWMTAILKMVLAKFWPMQGIDRFTSHLYHNVKTELQTSKNKKQSVYQISYKSVYISLMWRYNDIHITFSGLECCR